MDGISLAKVNHWVDVISSLQSLSSLSLEGCELSRVVYPYSSSINSSSSIVSLNVGKNNLTSSMYPWLFKLTNKHTLRTLGLYENKLDGIPKDFGNLYSLESLSLYNNSVVVSFPDFLNNLSGGIAHTLQDLHAPRSQFTGSISHDIQKFSSLKYLTLYENHLNGTISDKLWELPKLEDLDLCSNYLRGAISENIEKSNIFYMCLSKNSLEGVPSIDNMSNISYITILFLSSCNLGPRFPTWILTLKNLNRLDISYNNISGTIPLEFLDTWTYICLMYMNLSSNNISGELPYFPNIEVIDFSSNNLSGQIPILPSTLKLLNLSKNKFNGGISFLCKTIKGGLEFLDLSHNSLTGQLPNCLHQFKELKVLNLGHNNLSGRLPLSIGNLIELEALYLYENNLSGELPFSLKNCMSLNSLNLGANKFSGNIPLWIGENLVGLYFLILRSNNFFGTIPSQLCQIQKLQVLDLSMNNLRGTIPSCLNNLTSMVQEQFSPPPNIHSFNIGGRIRGTAYNPYINLDNYEYVDHAMIDWLGSQHEFISSNLGLLKIIDLSTNNLTGHIPYEITNLYELIALNLSNNALLGNIPPQIGQMRKLVALDLSRNKLSGGIPSSMSQMTLLAYLDVSCNKLSGRIPSSTQLQSFEPSRYAGNAGLYGPPLSENCTGDEDSKLPPLVRESDIDELWEWFYIGGGTGFATGFWIACSALLVNRRGRHIFFQSYDRFENWVYVKVLVSVSNLQRVFHT